MICTLFLGRVTPVGAALCLKEHGGRKGETSCKLQQKPRTSSLCLYSVRKLPRHPNVFTHTTDLPGERCDPLAHADDRLPLSRSFVYIRHLARGFRYPGPVWPGSIDLLHTTFHCIDKPQRSHVLTPSHRAPGRLYPETISKTGQ